MVQRYIRIRAEIKKVEAVEETIPTGAKIRKKLDLFKHLKKFESICLRLQRDDTDMTEMRVMFRVLITEYPVTGEHLKATAKIVHRAAFETGVVMVINGSLLASAEALVLKPFEVTPTAGKKRKERDEDYASQLLRSGGKKRKPTSNMKQYMPLIKMIPPTSNIVQRLFSQCKLVLTPQRRSMDPANFEQLAFLRVNRDMWDVSTVASVTKEQNE
ncbi:hypothetical protein PC129_g10785 [Phytophthora cactorum]|uniref:HAT C-terminal dimerisation domain-containing protein n=1 Tax=Phytophthora cactorum TaxID=29920 RepID=A0A329SBK4_9STRA|nr:hypothetical protein Pcac1_g7245 [Phytophthora cactorum]KAG2805238.1 hypothetical protein PC111_g17906 [Phytophthora cactorum]KAG2821943.1 hypothetical protein PC112_g11152 [Phytophthora cactorum]KAG2856819.1 hypothetical protein PC113_g11240 [Phytophthora cactorum]KAG2907785.1 hypothetical protein PC114_g10721 [Phytophthora cactorum]